MPLIMYGMICTCSKSDSMGYYEDVLLERKPEASYGISIIHHMMATIAENEQLPKSYK